ncbi:gluconokinase [Gordonia sp. NPDC003429]
MTSSVGPIVVAGVSGCGKSTVGAALAAVLAVPFADADDLHPPSNIEKMRAGIPLTDVDRRPWLTAVGTWLADHPEGGVMACSALRRTYRDRLRRAAPTTRFVMLDIGHDDVTARLKHRPGHFMPASLADSQFATYQPLGRDEPGITVRAERPMDDVVAEVVDHLLR